MKPFNIDDAKAGKPVCTRDGRNVRIICFDAKCEYYPIVALVEKGNGKEYISSYCLNGQFHLQNEDELDLFMKPEKHERFGWLSRNNTTVTACAYTYNTKEEALSHKPGRYDTEEFVLAKIEWEE